VLEQDQGHPAVAELAERVVDPIRCTHHLVRALERAELRLDRFVRVGVMGGAPSAVSRSRCPRRAPEGLFTEPHVRPPSVQ
jgi:hypothetical protein